MESTKVSKLDLIIRKLYLLEKKVNKIYNEVFLSRSEKMKKKQIEEYEELNGKVEP